MKLLGLTKASLVAAALLATAVVATVSAPASGAISTPTGPGTPVTPTPSQVTTVATIDVATGKVISKWTGPASQNAQAVQAQRKAIGAPTPVTAPPHGVTPLISRHSPCTANTGYFELWNSGLVCFANSGGTSVTIYSVYEVDTGNNRGGVYWQCGSGTCDSGYWPKWSTVLFNAPYPTITFVYIQ